MKIIKYRLIDQINVGTFEEPVYETVPGYEARCSYSEKILDYVKRTAYNGAYEIVEDGRPEPPPLPPTNEELAEQLTSVDETAVALYEALAEQEAINTAQDEVLVEIYERTMI